MTYGGLFCINCQAICCWKSSRNAPTSPLFAVWAACLPGCHQYCNNSALKIVEVVLDSAVPAPNQSLMRAVVHIQSRSFECQTWEEVRGFSLATQSSPALGPDTPPAVLRKFVSLAHRIYVLAQLCISRSFQRYTLILMKACKNPIHSHLPKV